MNTLVNIVGLNGPERSVFSPDIITVALLIQVMHPRNTIMPAKVKSANRIEFKEAKPMDHKETHAESELLVQRDQRTANIVNVAVVCKDKRTMSRRFLERRPGKRFEPRLRSEKRLKTSRI